MIIKNISNYVTKTSRIIEIVSDNRKPVCLKTNEVFHCAYDLIFAKNIEEIKECLRKEHGFFVLNISIETVKKAFNSIPLPKNVLIVTDKEIVEIANSKSDVRGNYRYIYSNLSLKSMLQTYEHLGFSSGKRQTIKAKRSRILSNIKGIELREREAILESLKNI